MRRARIAERQAEMPHFTAWFENAKRTIPLAGRVVKVDTAYADWEIDRQAAAEKRRLARERRAANKARAQRIVDAFCKPEVQRAYEGLLPVDLPSGPPPKKLTPLRRIFGWLW